MSGILYHGGVRGLNPGDIIEPGHHRAYTDDCPLCRMHDQDNPNDPDRTQHQESVYCTNDKQYARMYAAITQGDLYQVRPLDCQLQPGDEGSDVEEYRCDRLIVVRCVERHVKLTWKDRRRYARRIQRIEAARGITDYSNVLPRNATPAMIARWQQREIQRAERMMPQ